MIPALDFDRFPERPPSEVEWEDLLVRLEIAPRALRIAVEETTPGTPALLEVLTWSVVAERTLQQTLEAMLEEREGPAGVSTELDVPEGGDPATYLVQRFEAARMRSFVLVQRRGVNVWEMRSRGGVYDGATTYQLLCATQALDRERLARIRSFARGG